MTRNILVVPEIGKPIKVEIKKLQLPWFGSDPLHSQLMIHNLLIKFPLILKGFLDS